MPSRVENANALRISRHVSLPLPLSHHFLKLFGLRLCFNLKITSLLIHCSFVGACRLYDVQVIFTNGATTTIKMTRPVRSMLEAFVLL